MNAKTWMSRRNVLRGLGVGLALPWLESLSPPLAYAQAATPIKRYLLMYFPCGVARAYWPPKGAGAGSAWSLSALLEPLAPYKKYLQVLSNVGQEELYNAGVNPNPSHSLYCAPSFSCTVPDTKLPILGGPTVDQIIAQKIGGSPFKSLQIGCSTMNSSSDGRHPSITRSISWSASDVPLYKEVNPQAVFDSLVMQLAPGGATDPANQAMAQLRKDRDLSVLDYVSREAASLNSRLSASDRRRLDQFLTSVRDLETRTKLQGTTMPGSTKTYTRPTLSASYNERRASDAVSPNDPVGYNRNDHAEVMNDLITMAFETDLTRVISHMLDDARSDYHYRFLKQRSFSGDTSTEINAPLNTVLQGSLLGYHGLSHDGDNNNGFATVNYWFVQKLASLMDRLSKATEPGGGGKSVLDNTFILFMSGMQGSSHQLTKLPIVIASGGSIFKADYHNNFPAQVRLADVHLTILQAGFGVQMTTLGYSGGTVPALLV
jgi:BMFP domain-containing protein YqiC